ncbi:1028_t:CDS:1, partial [Entrophospora sp. SA101]
LITAERFICIDDKTPMQELTNKEIIRAVESNSKVNNSDEEGEAETMVIPDKEALNNLEK